MTVLVVIFSLCAIGIVLFTFRIGSKLEKTDRQIAELRKRIGADDARS